MSLTPEQQGQLEDMIKSGKSHAEVNSFFLDKYNVGIPYWKFNYLINKLFKKKSAPVKSRRKKQPDVPGDNVKDLIDQLRAELEAYSAYVIKKVRIDLIKAIGEARQKRIDVGEDVAEFKITED